MPEQTGYIFSADDTSELVAKGYTIQGLQTEELAIFMQTHYPGFALKQFLLEAEELMNPGNLTALQRYILIAGTTITAGFKNNYTDEDDALVFERKFYKENGKLIVSHEYLILPEKERGKNTVKKVLGSSLNHYIQMNADYVIVWAGLSKGAYVWARFGFTAMDQQEMNKILQIAKNNLSMNEFRVVQLIYDSYYSQNPEGNEFPIKLWADLPFMKNLLMNPACCWHGRLDLKNPEQLRKFGEYVTYYK